MGDFTFDSALINGFGNSFCSDRRPECRFAEGLSIHCNDEQASYEVTQFLIDQGHQRLGFIKGDPIHAATAHRFEGYLRALKANEIEYHGEYVQDGQFSFESGKSATRAMLDLRAPPVCHYCQQ